jgi:hypothetical protein
MLPRLDSGSLPVGTRRDERFTRALSAVLSDRRAIVVLVAAYLALGLCFLATDYTLNDEGQVTVMFARWARTAPLAVFFFQRAKPILVALYLPAGFAGHRAVLACHLLVASAAIPLMYGTARALGLRLPVIAALAVAASPLYLLGGPAGISNVDGVLGVSLVLWLLAARRSWFAAGLVLGMLPWVRHELALFAVILAAYALCVERRPMMVVGALAFPCAYAAAGALYHRDELWMLHFPGATLYPMPGNPVWEPFEWRKLLHCLVAVTPLIAFAFGTRPPRLGGLERALLVFAATLLSVTTILPIWRVANFGFLPRYALQALPAVALLANRTAARWLEDGRCSLADDVFPVLLGVACIEAGYASSELAIPVLGACVIALALAHARRAAAGVAVMTALTIAGPLLPVHTEIPAHELAPYLPALTGWLRDHRAVLRGTPLYTNVPLLARHLERSHDFDGVDVLFTVTPDQIYDFDQLGDADNGQRATLKRLVGVDMNGRGVVPDALTPERVPDGALFAVRLDRRLSLLLPDATWKSHLATLAERRDPEPGFRVMRFHREPAAMAR